MKKTSNNRTTSAPRLYREVKERMFRDFVRPLLAAGGGEMPSKKELAGRYGVNVGTLDKALQELALEGYVEKRVGSGTYVLPRREKGLGEVGVYIHGGRVTADWKPLLFYDQLDVRLQEELGAAGREFRHHVDTRLEAAWDKPPKALLEDIEAGRISSLITLRFEEAHEVWLHKLGIPVLALGHDFGWGCVAFDMLDAGFEAAAALIVRGCSRIELLSANVHEWLFPEVMATSNRPLRAGMANAMRRAGLPAPECWLKPEMLLECDYGPPFTVGAERSGYELCKMLFRHHRPDGLVVYTDVFAVGVARALAELGLRPGRDLQAAVLCNEGVDFPELAGFVRLELSLKETAAGLVSLAAAAERGEPPQELRIKYKNPVAGDSQKPAVTTFTTLKREVRNECV